MSDDDLDDLMDSSDSDNGDGLIAHLAAHGGVLGGGHTAAAAPSTAAASRPVSDPYSHPPAPLPGTSAPDHLEYGKDEAGGASIATGERALPTAGTQVGAAEAASPAGRSGEGALGGRRNPPPADHSSASGLIDDIRAAWRSARSAGAHFAAGRSGVSVAVVTEDEYSRASSVSPAASPSSASASGRPRFKARIVASGYAGGEEAAHIAVPGSGTRRVAEADDAAAGASASEAPSSTGGGHTEEKDEEAAPGEVDSGVLAEGRGGAVEGIEGPPVNLAEPDPDAAPRQSGEDDSSSASAPAGADVGDTATESPDASATVPQKAIHRGDAALRAAVAAVADAIERISPSTRAAVWKFSAVEAGICSESALLTASGGRRSDSGYYETLMKRAESISGEELTDEGSMAAEVDLDIPRTSFDGIAEQELPIVRRMLVAHCLRDPVKGYAQGMNFLAAAVLHVLGNEEDAFWQLEHLLSPEMCGDNYDRTLTGVHVDLAVLGDLVARHMPHLSKTLDDVPAQTAWFLSNFLLTLLVNSVPREAWLKIWDAAFVLGTTPIVLSIALAFFESIETELIAAEPFDLMMVFAAGLRQWEDGCDGRTLLETTLRFAAQVNPDVVHRLRDKHRPRVLDQLAPHKASAAEAARVVKSAGSDASGSAAGSEASAASAAATREHELKQMLWLKQSADWLCTQLETAYTSSTVRPYQRVAAHTAKQFLSTVDYALQRRQISERLQRSRTSSLGSEGAAPRVRFDRTHPVFAHAAGGIREDDEYSTDPEVALADAVASIDTRSASGEATSHPQAVDQSRGDTTITGGAGGQVAPVPDPGVARGFLAFGGRAVSADEFFGELQARVREGFERLDSMDTAVPTRSRLSRSVISRLEGASLRDDDVSAVAFGAEAAARGTATPIAADHAQLMQVHCRHIMEQLLADLVACRGNVPAAAYADWVIRTAGLTADQAAATLSRASAAAGSASAGRVTSLLSGIGEGIVGGVGAVVSAVGNLVEAGESTDARGDQFGAAAAATPFDTTVRWPVMAYLLLNQMAKELLYARDAGLLTFECAMEIRDGCERLARAIKHYLLRVADDRLEHFKRQATLAQTGWASQPLAAVVYHPAAHVGVTPIWVLQATLAAASEVPPLVREVPLDASLLGGLVPLVSKWLHRVQRSGAQLASGGVPSRDGGVGDPSENVLVRLEVLKPKLDSVVSATGPLITMDEATSMQKELLELKGAVVNIPDGERRRAVDAMVNAFNERLQEAVRRRGL